MKLSRVAVAAMLLLTLVYSPPVHGSTLEPIPPFSGASIPLPPEQNAPWSTPQGIPPALLGATVTLFDQGFPDPRGCDYREVTVHLGDAYTGEGGAARVHGWVLPASGNISGRFVICWNGLEYPALTVGPKADLVKDARALADLPAKSYFVDNSGLGQPDFTFSSDRGIFEQWISPLKACLLTRLGEGDLASRLWSQVVDRKMLYPRNEDDKQYLGLATDWAWSLYYRAVCSHMCGDDRLSLLSAEELSRIQPQIEASAELEGLPKPQEVYPIISPVYLDFLAQLPQLLADEQRRINETPKAPLAGEVRDYTFYSHPASPDTRSPADKSKRIDELIDDLENSGAYEGGDSAYTRFPIDPTVQALVAEGNDAVEPLLKVLVDDDRLCRAAHFRRDYENRRYLVGVSDAAYETLTLILRKTFYNPKSSYDGLDVRTRAERTQIADSMRNFWLHNKDISLQDRYYNTLADDTAAPEAWLEASNELVQPWLVDEKHTLFGDSIRTGKNPAVTAIMIERWREMNDKRAAQRSHDSTNLLDCSTRMALNLSKWDANAASQILKQQFDVYTKLSLNDRRNNFAAQNCIYLTKARLAGNDANAMPDFVSALLDIGLDTSGDFDLASVLEVLWRYSDNPPMESAAQSLFVNSNSPLYDLSNTNPQSDIISTPLLGISVFREAIVRGLNDKEVVGESRVDYRHFTTITLKHVGTTSYLAHELPVGSHYQIRKADLLAESLQFADGMQDFELYWPITRRDAAINADIAIIARYGERYAYVDGMENVDRIDELHRAHMVFTPLTRPATKDDIDSGLAIFTLGKGASAIPFTPVAATLGHPYNPAGDTNGKVTNGWIWQKEKDRNGNLFYGFVGPGVLAMEPASNVIIEPIR